MALKDMKSSLNKGIGKPLGSPSGRHLKSPTTLGRVDVLAGERSGGLEKSPTKKILKYQELTANGKKV